MLCNPDFICKNNQYFSLSSIYFLYPLTSLPKMVKLEMPASIEQSELFVLVTMPLSPKINKREMLARLCRMMLMGRREAVHSEASLTLEISGDPRTTNTRHR